MIWADILFSSLFLTFIYCHFKKYSLRWLRFSIFFYSLRFKESFYFICYVEFCIGSINFYCCYNCYSCYSYLLLFETSIYLSIEYLIRSKSKYTCLWLESIQCSIRNPKQLLIRNLFLKGFVNLCEKCRVILLTCYHSQL